MTDKELHRLSRRELLQLLLTQAKDTEELRRLSEEREEQLESLKKSYDHLKRRLDKKDEQIQELRTALYEERSDRRIKLDEAGSIAEAALKLNEIFDMAQKAADQYLYNIKLMHEKEEPYEEAPEKPEEDIAEPEPEFQEDEPENWEEEMLEPEPEFPEDEPKNQEEEMSEPEPEFPEDELEKWEVEIVDLELDHSGKDTPASKAEKPQPRGGKKSSSHKKHSEHKKRVGILWRNR